MEFEESGGSKLVAEVGWLHGYPGISIRRFLPKKGKPGEFRVSRDALTIGIEKWHEFLQMIDAINRTLKREGFSTERPSLSSDTWPEDP